MTWGEASLEELGVEAQAGFPSGKHNRTGQGIPHLRPMNVSRDGCIELSDLKYVVPDRDLRIHSGDVLFNNTNSPPLVGKTAHFDQPGEFAFSNHMTRLRPPEGLDSKFLALQLHTFWKRGIFRAMCTKHVNQASVSTRPLLGLRVAVPPFAEQRRIVAAIEEQFSRLDAATELLRSAARRSDALWRSQLMTAFDEQCDAVPLSQVLEHSIGGVWGTEAGTGAVDVSAFRVTEFRDDGVIDPSTAARRAITYAQLSSRELREDDLLLEKSGGGPDRPVGRIAWVGAHVGPAVCSNFVQLLRVDKNLGDSRYIFYWLTRRYLDGSAADNQTASTGHVP